MLLSVVIITYNEEANLARTLASVQPLVADGRGEIIVVDSASTDRTVEVAQSFGAKVFVEHWKGYAAQKNSAIDKAQGDWILSLDADEEVEKGLSAEIHLAICGGKLPTLSGKLGQKGEDSLDTVEKVIEVEEQLATQPSLSGNDIAIVVSGYFIPRKNFFLGRWIKHGGYWRDPKLRLFRKGSARFEDRLVHEDAKLTSGVSERLTGALLHHSYPTLADYIDHMNRYSSLGAEMAVAKGQTHFNILNIVFRPTFTFFYNYILRLGFLDGREGLLLHLNHAVYVSWKYAKAWELARTRTVPR